MDPTRDFGYYGDANLQDYLRRPVKILDELWTVTTGTFQEAIDPWSLFIEDPNVRNRIEGYRLLQGKLHLRLAINGGPFFYGRMIAAYFPRQEENNHSFGAVHGDYYKQQLSQLPHVFLDPTTSEGGEIACPFFNPDNWIDLTGDSYRKMGRLHLQSLNNLLHANSSTGAINITVYAWMEDARLAAPTSRNYNSYTFHSGTEVVTTAAGISILGAIMAWLNNWRCTYQGANTHTEHEPEPHESQAGDEYGTGILSKPASAIAKVAGMLSNIPAIRPFARPTEMVASTVGRAAHLFGYSRPAIVSDLSKAKIKGTGHLANTDSHEAVTKLTLDTKQELTIDPRTVGLSDIDEMAFDFIKQKEAFMSSMIWEESNTGGTTLGNISVGPDFHNREVINLRTLHLLAPMYTVAAPFTYWRGSLKFRFQLVASQMHRGRIRIIYEPMELQSGSPDENTVYSRIIDLATNRDFEMVVSWNHPSPWLFVKNRLNGSSFNHSGAGLVTFDRQAHNGQIRLEVVNELTSPNPALAQPVYINLFVSACEDFEVAAPSDEILSHCEYEPQSGYEPQADGEEIVDEEDNIPESPTPITSIGTEEWTANPGNHIFFGETFKSIRALLKRYCFHMAYGGTEGVEYYVLESNFPVEPGQSIAPRHMTSEDASPASTPYNYSSMTYLNWFTPCYAGWRGGLRSKYVPSNGSDSGHLSVRRVTDAVDQSDCGVYLYPFSSTSWDSLAQSAVELLHVGSGHDVVHPNVDGSLEVEFPFYANKRFAPARRFLGGSGSFGNQFLGENAGHIMYHFSTTRPSSLRYVAAGDDFSLFFWVGQPGIFYRNARPASGASTTTPSY